jgi:nucleotide-binding universal stress UspA family protein
VNDHESGLWQDILDWLERRNLLVVALDTDLEWVRAHTRLLNRSLDVDRTTAFAEEAAAEYRTVPSSSPARGLAGLAEEEGAAMVVAGSHRSGAFGRVASGGTAERLLHGSGCPVAVAPRGYRRRITDKLRRIGVAFVDTPDGHEAVRQAADLAARTGLPLTLFSVVTVHHTWFVPEVVRPEEDTLPIEVRKEYQDALDRALAELSDDVRATGELIYGEVVDELSVVGERGVDLLVCGSRGYGPVRRVLLGTVSAALLRQASVPVLVVPRGDDAS